MKTTTARQYVAANVRALMGRGVDSLGKRVTQKQLGIVLGLSQGPVSERLAGEQAFTFDELIKLANFFNVPISHLFAGVEDQEGATPRIHGASSPADPSLFDLAA